MNFLNESFSLNVNNQFLSEDIKENTIHSMMNSTTNLFEKCFFPDNDCETNDSKVVSLIKQTCTEVLLVMSSI
jgi:hypothetical protein